MDAVSAAAVSPSWTGGGGTDAGGSGINGGDGMVSEAPTPYGKSGDYGTGADDSLMDASSTYRAESYAGSAAYHSAPTEKQLYMAQKLGISGAEGMSRGELSRELQAHGMERSYFNSSAGGSYGTTYGGGSASTDSRIHSYMGDKGILQYSDHRLSKPGSFASKGTEGGHAQQFARVLAGRAYTAAGQRLYTPRRIRDYNKVNRTFAGATTKFGLDLKDSMRFGAAKAYQDMNGGNGDDISGTGQL